MKHNIRQRVINQYGLPVTKVESVNGELGSGIFDKNGVEIFEGDTVKVIDDKGNGYTTKIIFKDGALAAQYKRRVLADPLIVLIPLAAFNDKVLQVVGHIAED